MSLTSPTLAGGFFTTSANDKPIQHIKKQSHHFADIGRIVKSMVFPVVIYKCECWSIKKTEHQRIDVFELCCWRILLRVL